MTKILTRPTIAELLDADTRLSARQCQERMEAKSTNAVRSELQLINQAFFDDTPEVSVEHRSLSANWLVRMVCVFTHMCFS